MKEQSAGAQSQDSDATSNASDGFLRSWTARYCTLHPGPSRATRVIRVIRIILEVCLVGPVCENQLTKSSGNTRGSVLEHIQHMGII